MPSSAFLALSTSMKSAEPSERLVDLLARRIGAGMSQRTKNGSLQGVSPVVTPPASSSSANESSANEAPVINVLALSAGGQFGAFASGFMAGWTGNQTSPRPEFNIVTGVSAGAIVAPYVFAGSQYDDRLRNAWRGVENADVFRDRPYLEALFSPSIKDVAPLERTLRKQVDVGLIADIEARAANGGQLLLGAVNIDTTKFEIFDVGALAAGGLPVATKQDCTRAAMLASAAIPILFQPRVINDALYVDGGARKHLFLRDVDQIGMNVVLQALAKATDTMAADTGLPAPKVNVYIIVNGDVLTLERETEYGLLDIGIRTFGAVTDETLRQSIVEAIDFAVNQKWTVRAVTAQDVEYPSGCDAREFDDVFVKCATETLYDAGLTMGEKLPMSWMTDQELRELLRTYRGYTN